MQGNTIEDVQVPADEERDWGDLESRLRNQVGSMIDNAQMRLLLENMERKAEEVLQRDAAFFEALYALKSEIEKDPPVRSAMQVLETTGHRAFTSFVPRVSIRIRKGDDVLALPRRVESSLASPNELAREVSDELRSAANAVIERSGYRQELNAIINEAIGSSQRFEKMASEIDRAGYEIIICIDFSPYTRVHAADTATLPGEPAHLSKTVDTVPYPPLSQSDLRFLRALKIRADF